MGYCRSNSDQLLADALLDRDIQRYPPCGASVTHVCAPMLHSRPPLNGTSNPMLPSRPARSLRPLRTLALLALALFALTLAACESDPPTAAVVESGASPTPVPTATPEPTATHRALTPEPSLTRGSDRNAQLKETARIQLEANSQRVPVWSPDGARIAFNYGEHIYVVESDGSRLQLISDPPPDDAWYADVSPSISPDGSRVAFATFRHESGGMVFGRLFGGKRNFEIVTSALDGSDHRRLTEHKALDTNPVWSPDGTRIAFVSYRVLDNDSSYHSFPEIYTMAADGSDVRIVTPPSLRITKDPPVWSPDGRHIAFLTDDEDVRNDDGRARVLYTVAADGSDLRRIAQTTTRPAWSLDGSRIAFARDQGLYAKIYTARPDGSDLQEVPNLGQHGVVSQLSWSVDGSEIRFMGRQFHPDPDGGIGRYSFEALRAIKVDGSGVRVIAWGRRREGSSRGGPSHSLVAGPVENRRPRGLLRPAAPGLALHPGRGRLGQARLGERKFRASCGRCTPDWRDVSEDIVACSDGDIVPKPEKNPGLVQDCETLLRVRDRLAGDAVLNWSPNVQISDWQGVGVGSEPARVIRLVLPGLSPSKLTGVLPSELGNLAGLEVLSVEFNRLSGDARVRQFHEPNRRLVLVMESSSKHTG